MVLGRDGHHKRRFFRSVLSQRKRGTTRLKRRVNFLIKKNNLLNRNWTPKKYHREEYYVRRIKYIGDSVLFSYQTANFFYSRCAPKIFDPGGETQSLSNQLTDQIQPQLHTKKHQEL